MLIGLEKGKILAAITLMALLLLVILYRPILTSSDQTSNSSAPTNWSAKTWFHVRGGAQFSPLALSGLNPAQVKSAYNLPLIGGAGTTIAIIDAYDDPTVASDLNAFSNRYGLTPVNFTEHKMSSSISADGGWALEISLDVQWAHAIAPNATILLVEATSASDSDLLAAVNYATSQPNVVAVSMSWGGNEFFGETFYDSYFAKPGITFFASSGDSGSGVIWPSSSPNVIAVGGTTLNLNSDGSFNSEIGWSGSGGGPSRYETEPPFQVAYGIQGTNGFRGVPDVSYNADPNTGVLVYDSTPYNGQTGWWIVGGTSAGAPQWAAIHSLGLSSSNINFYTDAKSSNYGFYFRDITSGSNGRYSTNTGYDLVTGLGSPLTQAFGPRTTHLLLNVLPNEISYLAGQTLNLEVVVLNQANPPLSSTLSLTVTGPDSFSYYNFQQVNVTANSSYTYSLAWNVPQAIGSYFAEVSLVPALLQAYDAAWLSVK